MYHQVLTNVVPTRRASDHFDDGPSHLHYLIPSGIGWLLRVRPELFAAVARCWRVGLVVGMAAFAFVAWVEGTWPGDTPAPDGVAAWRSEEHTSELQSLMRISYAVFCFQKKKQHQTK